MECPRPIGGQLKADLERIHVYKQQHPEMPQWARAIALARDYFEDTILVHSGVFGKTYYRFVYAVISPTDYLALSRAELNDDHVGLTTGGELDSIHPDMHIKSKFDLNYASCISAEVLKDVPIEDMSILTDVVIMGGTEAGTDMFPEQ